MLRAWVAGLKTGLYYLRTLHPASMETIGGRSHEADVLGSRDCCT